MSSKASSGASPSGVISSTLSAGFSSSFLATWVLANGELFDCRFFHKKKPTPPSRTRIAATIKKITRPLLLAASLLSMIGLPLYPFRAADSAAAPSLFKPSMMMFFSKLRTV